MGVYPLLPDETCWFLAVDFDKSSWREDVRAFAETARRLRLPALVERSRSGNGAHVWFFFSEPSVFLDENLNAYPDDQQWSALASVQRIEPAVVDRIALDATRTGTIVGVRVAQTAEDEEGAAPWQRPPSGTPRARRVLGPMPARVSAVLAQRLFIAKDGIPSALLNQIKRLAAFQNPEFYKKQSLRLSTAMTPRVIQCAEELLKHIALPRGCKVDLEELLRVHGVALDVADERVTGSPTEDLSAEYEDDVLRVFDHESATDRADDFAEGVP